MPSADAIHPEISTLDNGLRIVTTSIPTAQSASTAFFVRVGSRGENRRNNGVSHYLEHMLFKGTTQRPTAPEISQAIEGAGGALNAYTSSRAHLLLEHPPVRARRDRHRGRRRHAPALAPRRRGDRP